MIPTAVSTNNLNAVKALLRTLFPDDYQFTTASGSRALKTGARVRLGATYAGGGDTGSVYRYTGAAATLDLSATNYAAGPWVKLVGSDGDLANLWPNIGNLSDSDARAVGGLVVVNDVRSRVAPSSSTRPPPPPRHGRGDRVGDDRGERRDQRHRVRRVGMGVRHRAGGQRPDHNQPRPHSATARITDSAITGAVAVAADNTSAIDARLHSALSTGDTGVGFAIAFNTIGWKPQNFLFNVIDAILGDPLISRRSTARAGETRADRELDRRPAAGPSASAPAATNRSTPPCRTPPTRRVGALRRHRQGGRRRDRLQQGRSTAEAGVAGSTVTGGAVDVVAEDAAGIFANVKLVSSSVTSNDGGAASSRARSTTSPRPSTTTTRGCGAKFGERVRIAAGYIAEDFTSDAGVGRPGARLEGPAHRRLRRLPPDVEGRQAVADHRRQRAADGGDADTAIATSAGRRVDLGAENFGETARWAKLGGEPGATYQYQGTAGTTTCADFDTRRLVPGRRGRRRGLPVDGPRRRPARLDLGTQNYLDLRFWKRVLATGLLPSGINVTDRTRPRSAGSSSTTTSAATRGPSRCHRGCREPPRAAG